MTANAFAEDRTVSAQAGMDDVPAKPVDPPAFSAARPKWLRAPGGAPVRASDDATPLAADSECRRRLAEIPGIDLEGGLAVIRGNVRKYGRLLSLFADGNADRVAQLADILDRRDFDALRRVAYALRGSAGMLGAPGLAEAAAAVILALREDAGEDEVLARAGAMSNRLADLVAGIRTAKAGLPA